MKKIAALLLTGMIAAGCSPEQTADAPKEEPSCADIYAACIEGTDFADMTELDSDYIYNYYGIDTQNTEDYAAGESTDVMKTDVLIILKEDDDDERAQLKELLETFKERKCEELITYNPGEYDKAQNGAVGETGSYVYAVMCENSDDAVNIIEGLF